MSSIFFCYDNDEIEYIGDILSCSSIASINGNYYTISFRDEEIVNIFKSLGKKVYHFIVYDGSQSTFIGNCIVSDFKADEGNWYSPPIKNAYNVLIYYKELSFLSKSYQSQIDSAILTKKREKKLNNLI